MNFSNISYTVILAPDYCTPYGSRNFCKNIEAGFQGNPFPETGKVVAI